MRSLSRFHNLKFQEYPELIMQPNILFYFHSALAELFCRVAWKVLLSNSKYEINKTSILGAIENVKIYAHIVYVLCHSCHTPSGANSASRGQRGLHFNHPGLCVCIDVYHFHCTRLPLPTPYLHLPFMHCHALLRPWTSARIACSTITKFSQHVFAAGFIFFVYFMQQNAEARVMPKSS